MSEQHSQVGNVTIVNPPRCVQLSVLQYQHKGKVWPSCMVAEGFSFLCECVLIVSGFILRLLTLDLYVKERVVSTVWVE